MPDKEGIGYNLDKPVKSEMSDLTKMSALPDISDMSDISTFMVAYAYAVLTNWTFREESVDMIT